MDITTIDYWPLLASAVHAGIALLVSAHVVLYKRDVRAAIGWIGLVWLAPLIGSALYILLGVNRIQRRANLLRRDTASNSDEKAAVVYKQSTEKFYGSCQSADLDEAALETLQHFVNRVTHTPLTKGNSVQVLRNGDEAYPAMLAAINKAKQTIALSTFIFDHDKSGKAFVAALTAASQRGVTVRVLIDAVGARYSRPRTYKQLRKNGVNAAEFLKPFLPWKSRYMNLRNHRKILVVDGAIGFSGGLNIRDTCVLQLKPKHPVQDIHFRFQGPVVRSLMQVFAEDWLFATEEILQEAQWMPEISAAENSATGNVAARGIPDGPDEDFEAIRWTLMGALSCARHSVKIQTPYFLPDPTLVTALGIAAKRGVTVDIILPGKNNLRFVQWATMAQLWQVLEHGCRVWFSAPPFDHSKQMVVDNAWSMVGSANWDQRSLRLNFEFNVECYSTALARQLNQHMDKIIEDATQVTMKDVNNRSLFVRLRDGIVRLFSPYL